MTRISEIDPSGIFKFADLPKNNPKSFDHRRITISLVEHDYPAKTPAMWNAAYREFEIEGVNLMLVAAPSACRTIYEAFRADSRYLGGGAGVGFKETGFRLVDELDVAASDAGAINFVMKVEGLRLRGCNTDGAGYVRSLADELARRGQALEDKRIILLGAGGTAASIAFALAAKGARVVIANRSREKAMLLAENINRHIGRAIASAVAELEIGKFLPETDAVINATTKGSTGQLAPYSALAPSELPPTEKNLESNRILGEAMLGLLPPWAVVSDVVITEKGTPLLRAAQAFGLTVLNGIPMVINQGAEAFWLLHEGELRARGILKDRVFEVMRAAALAP